MQSQTFVIELRICRKLKNPGFEHFHDIKRID